MRDRVCGLCRIPLKIETNGVVLVELDDDQRPTAAYMADSYVCPECQHEVLAVNARAFAYRHSHDWEAKVGPYLKDACYVWQGQNGLANREMCGRDDGLTGPGSCPGLMVEGRCTKCGGERCQPPTA